MENWLIILVIWGEAELFSGIWEQRKILLGSRGNCFHGFWEINALFSGIKGAQTPPGGLSVVILLWMGDRIRVC